MQPLKYVIVNEKELLDQVFSNVAWAGYITPDGDPKDGERPVAYIIVLVDTEIKKAGFDVDAGAAVENILLASIEENIGTCWMGAINRANIREILNIPDKYTIHTLIALGYAAEEPIMEVTHDSIKYYKDDQGVLHVPKRKLEDILFINKEIK